MRYRTNDYSVPTEYGHRQVLVKGYVHHVVIACGSDVIAVHARSYEPVSYTHLDVYKRQDWGGGRSGTNRRAPLRTYDVG